MDTNVDFSFQQGGTKISPKQHGFTSALSDLLKSKNTFQKQIKAGNPSFKELLCTHVVHLGNVNDIIYCKHMIGPNIVLDDGDDDDDQKRRRRRRRRKRPCTLPHYNSPFSRGPLTSLNVLVLSRARCECSSSLGAVHGSGGPRYASIQIPAVNGSYITKIFLDLEIKKIADFYSLERKYDHTSAFSFWLIFTWTKSDDGLNQQFVFPLSVMWDIRLR